MHLPSGTEEGPTAELPLDGTIGIADPVGPRHGIAHWLLDPVEPHEGALHDALADMGVPDEWCNKRVVRGNFLISVRCNFAAQERCLQISASRDRHTHAAPLLSSRISQPQSFKHISDEISCPNTSCVRTHHTARNTELPDGSCED